MYPLLLCVCVGKATRALTHAYCMRVLSVISVCVCVCDEMGSVYKKSKEVVSTQSLLMGTTTLRNSMLTLEFRGAHFKPHYYWRCVISACYCDLTALTSLIGGRN